MAYNYIKRHVSSSKFGIKAPYKMDAQYITVHNTANKASAKNEASYHNSNNNQVSYHIAIDDIEAIEVVPLNRNAWHCGDGTGAGNKSSIGIEICYSTGDANKYRLAEQNAVELIAKMLKERGWNISRVKKHQDWSGKYCPHKILSEGRWDSFLSRVNSTLHSLKNPKDVTSQLGYNAPKDSTAYRLHTSPYMTFRAAQEASIGLVNSKYLKYSEVFGNDSDKWRVKSGKYNSQKDAESASIKMLNDGLVDYISIIGSKE